MRCLTGLVWSMRLRRALAEVPPRNDGDTFYSTGRPPINGRSLVGWNPVCSKSFYSIELYYFVDRIKNYSYYFYTTMYIFVFWLDQTNLISFNIWHKNKRMHTSLAPFPNITISRRLPTAASCNCHIWPGPTPFGRVLGSFFLYLGCFHQQI